MTDGDVLFQYRHRQAQECLAEAKQMVQQQTFTTRTIVNRAYYACFYGLLALFLRTAVHLKTSKHIGVITIFDRDFVLAGKIDKKYSETIHRLFKARQDADYKELVSPTIEQAIVYVNMADDFLSAIEKLFN